MSRIGGQLSNCPLLNPSAGGGEGSCNCAIVSSMSESIPLHASVALLEDVQATHFERGAPLLLRRGDVGTVVMTYDDGACEVEFSDRDGRAYAMLPLAADHVLVLRDAPERASV